MLKTRQKRALFASFAFRLPLMTGFRTYFQPRAVGVGFLHYPIPQRKTKEDGDPSSFVFGWGAGIRTPEMSESESDALPLGDTPIFSTLCIIADYFAFVNRYLQKKIVLFKLFFVFYYSTSFFIFHALQNKIFML